MWYIRNTAKLAALAVVSLLVSLKIGSHLSGGQNSFDYTNTQGFNLPFYSLPIRGIRPYTMDQSRRFGIQMFHTVGEGYMNLVSTSRVTLFSQSSLEYMPNIRNLAQRWSGPISITFYLPGIDYALGQIYLEYLKQCRPDTIHNLAFHFVFPVAFPPTGNLNELLNYMSPMDCTDHDTYMNRLLSQRSETYLGFRVQDHYPYNMLRNVAKAGSTTGYVIMVDMELIPNEGVYEMLDEFLGEKKAQNCPKCTFMIPMYEMNRTTNLPAPRNKLGLISLINQKLVNPFYGTIFEAFLTCIHLKEWERGVSKSRKSASILYATKYTFDCEPIVVAPSTAPPYEESIEGYGFDRSSHIMELYLAGYKFFVLDNIFFIHLGQKIISRVKEDALAYREWTTNLRQLKLKLAVMTAMYKKDACAELNLSIANRKSPSWAFLWLCTMSTNAVNTPWEKSFSLKD